MSRIIQSSKNLSVVASSQDKTVPIILTLNYSYQPQQQQWFNKEFYTFEELLKWLREDSILLLKEAELADNTLFKKLVLAKLALPQLKILILSESRSKQENKFFNYVHEQELERTIRAAIINEHKAVDNRKALLEALKIFG